MTGWHDCRFLTCSVLPVRRACNLRCPFCFSASSISSLAADTADLAALDVEGYYRFAAGRGATRLVVTGGGEPLLRPDAVVDLVGRGRAFFDEIACFTNGTFLTADLAGRLAAAGLSYVCYSRHAADDETNRRLMGPSAPDLDAVVAAASAAGLPIRATCVMNAAGVATAADVDRYMARLAGAGIVQFTFKHTYVAYPDSLFAGSRQDAWARRHRVRFDPFEGRGRIVARLPWGPAIRLLDGLQTCHYHEPTPTWELEHRIARSANLLSDGTVYASLEDRRSRLFRLRPSTPPSPTATSSPSGPSCRSATGRRPRPTAGRPPG